MAPCKGAAGVGCGRVVEIQMHGTTKATCSVTARLIEIAKGRKVEKISLIDHRPDAPCHFARFDDA